MLCARWEHVRSKVFLWGWRSEVKSVKSNVEGLRFRVFMSSCSLKCETLCEVKGLRSLVCSIKGRRLKEIGGLNFERYFCEV